MRNWTVKTIIFGTAAILFAAAPAAAQTPAVLGVGVQILKEEGFTSSGVGVDIAKGIAQINPNVSLGVVGDFTWVTDNGVRTNLFQGGVRATFGAAKVKPFAQFLVGAATYGCDGCDGATDAVFTVGGGVDVPLTPRINFRAQIDFPTVKYDGGSETTQRYFFGISLPIGK